MDFKPEEKTIKDLLVSGHQFEIPRFQRAYSWEKRHYAEFLGDIISNLRISDGTITTDPYFLGTMLFIGNFVDANRNAIKVVDGQQRLTTITILFSALSDLFKSCGEDALASKIFGYIMTTDDDNNSVRILKTKSNYPYFAYFIQDFKKEVKQAPQSEEEENIRQTYEYFNAALQDKKIRSLLKQRSGAAEINSLKYVDILKAVRDQVLACTFISISTSSTNQANRIFEILNAKGKRLDEVDLIKNAIFEVLDREEPVDFANEAWTNIRKTIEELDSGVGMSTFYRHFWAAVYKRSSSGKLYDDFGQKIHKTKSDYKAFLNEMKEYAKLYIQIISPNISYYNNKQQYRWLVQSLKSLTDTFGIIQVRVPLMGLLDAKNREVISMSVFKKCVTYLENFHYAFNVIVSDRGNKLDGIYSKFAIELHKSQNKENSSALVSDLIGKMDSLFPSYLQFKDEFMRMIYFKESIPLNMKTKYTLYKLNAFFSGEEIFPTDLSVEHIYPESASTHSGNIGNLILLESSLNEEAGNAEYSQKKAVYRKSRTKWMSLFLKEHPNWSSQDFPKRANELAKIYYTEILGRTIRDGKREAPKV